MSEIVYLPTSELIELTEGFRRLLDPSIHAQVFESWSDPDDCLALIHANKQIDGSDDCGVYSYGPQPDDCGYVGSAKVAFGSRFWSHAPRIESQAKEPIWQDMRTYRRLNFAREFVFLAPALECYLIMKSGTKLPLNRRL